MDITIAVQFDNHATYHLLLQIEQAYYGRLGNQFLFSLELCAIPTMSDDSALLEQLTSGGYVIDGEPRVVYLEESRQSPGTYNVRITMLRLTATGGWLLDALHAKYRSRA